MPLRRRGLLRLVGLAGLAGLGGSAGCTKAEREGAAGRGTGQALRSERATDPEVSQGLEVADIRESRRGAGEGVDLWIAGDLHWGEGGAEVLEPLRSLVPAGSLGVLNLEGPIGARPSDRVPSAAGEAPVLSNGEAVPGLLRALGVGVVGVANNHADDLGEAGRRRTIEALRGAGVDPVGGDVGAAIVERGGLRLGFSAHYLPPGAPVSVSEELRGLRAQVDHLIVMFHVDAPPSYLPSAELRAGVEQAVGAGASVVAAHGSHALARVERRGETVIAWGLGNLAFACRCTDEVDAGLLRIRLSPGGLTLAEWVPLAAGLDGQPVAAHPEGPLLFELLGSLRSSPGEVVDGRYRLDLGERRGSASS